jgi:arsenate reductase
MEPHIPLLEGVYFMTEHPIHILFLCVANSARSQLAEGLARHLFPPSVKISSAGSLPGTLNPLAVRAMQEVGVDISTHYSKSVHDIDQASVNLVITLCAEEVCPLFSHPVEKLHWGLPDPASAEGTEEERLEKFRQVRDHLTRRLQEFLQIRL